jgi:hypothetical protein
MANIGVNRIALTKTADGWPKLIEVDGFGRGVNKLNNDH